MNHVHGGNQLDSQTVMYGVFGDPVKHSKSPIMMNAAFRQLGLNAAYAAFHVAPGNLKDAIYGVRALGFRGINITVPHKVEVMKHLEEVDEDARMIGAVNTIVNEGGRLIGYNTDGIGYVRSLKEEAQAEIAGENILVIGAGGAARGICYALAKENPGMIWIANRTAERAVQLAASLEDRCEIVGMGFDGIDDIKDKVSIVINTTLAGMHPQIDQIPVDPAWFHSGITVSDIVYNPLETKLLQEAKKRGARIHGGLGMFIYQGAYALEYWTGAPAPVETMCEVVLQSLTQS
jgi:shikimate dehydrogenase